MPRPHIPLAAFKAFDIREARAAMPGASALDIIGTGQNTDSNRNEHPEDDFHASVVRELDKIWPRDTSDVIWWSNENRFQGKIDGGRNKARGLKAGVPDMTFLWRTRVAFIELKVPKNKSRTVQPSQINSAQSALFPRLIRAGFPVHVCLTLDQVFNALRAEHFPLPKGCCRDD